MVSVPAVNGFNVVLQRVQDDDVTCAYVYDDVTYVYDDVTYLQSTVSMLCSSAFGPLTISTPGLGCRA
jgi:hypothetical protein